MLPRMKLSKKLGKKLRLKQLAPPSSDISEIIKLSQATSPSSQVPSPLSQACFVLSNAPESQATPMLCTTALLNLLVQAQSRTMASLFLDHPCEQQSSSTLFPDSPQAKSRKRKAAPSMEEEEEKACISPWRSACHLVLEDPYLLWSAHSGLRKQEAMHSLAPKEGNRAQAVPHDYLSLVEEPQKFTTSRGRNQSVDKWPYDSQDIKNGQYVDSFFSKATS